MTTEELLRSAVKKLGPERAAQALLAYSEVQDSYNAWQTCALARVYGPCGELRALIADRLDVWGVASKAVGLPPVECEAVARCFDAFMLGTLQGLGYTPENGALLKSLLEAESGKIATARPVAVLAASEGPATPALQESET